MKISLKAARVNANLTQEDAAKALHKSKQTLVNWECGRCAIKFKDVLMLAELYDIPVECLDIPVSGKNS